MTSDEELMRMALEALVLEAGSEPALYAAQTYAAIAALASRLTLRGRALYALPGAQGENK